MNIYKEAEKELADLLGWTDMYWLRDDCLLGVSPTDRKAMVKVTGWCSDNNESFKLMVEYEINIKNYYNSVYATFDLLHNGAYGNIDEHNQDRALATRYAIILSVITKLKASK
jgi:hypothetical protein